MIPHHYVNIRYIVDNYHFDAAIDYSGGLGRTTENLICIELFNLDANWDVKKIYQGKENIKNNKCIIGDINTDFNSFVDFDFIIEETKKWIKQMSE